MTYQQELQGPDETVGSGAAVAYLWSRVGDTRPVSSGIITADTGLSNLTFDVHWLLNNTLCLRICRNTSDSCCLTLEFQSAKPLPMGGLACLQRSSKLLVSPRSKCYTQRCQYWSTLLLWCTRYPPSLSGKILRRLQPHPDYCCSNVINCSQLCTHNQCNTINRIKTCSDLPLC